MIKYYLGYTVRTSLLSLIFMKSFLCDATPTSPYQVQVVTELLEPYQMYNDDGTVGGFATDIVAALFKQASATAKIKVMPWPRAYSTALNMKNVMIYSMTKTQQRREKFLWIGEVFEEKLCFWSLKNNDKKAEVSLENSEFSAPRDSVIAQYLLDHDFKNIYYTSNGSQSVEMLFSGRTDLLLSTEHGLKVRLRKLGLDFSKLKKVFDEKTVSSPMSIAFNIDSDSAMVKHFQKAFLEIKNNGTLGEITKKWGIRQRNKTCY